MRTTVTLEEDVADRLKEHARKRRISFKQAINEVARRGLASQPVKPKPYRVPSLDMKLRPGVDLTKALQLAAEMEDQEIIHKMTLGK